MPLGIPWRYLLFKKIIIIIKWERMSTSQTMCENESYTMGRGVEMHTVNVLKQHRSSQNFV